MYKGQSESGQPGVVVGWDQFSTRTRPAAQPALGQTMQDRQRWMPFRVQCAPGGALKNVVGRTGSVQNLEIVLRRSEISLAVRGASWSRL